MGSFIWKVAVPSWYPQLVSPFGGRPSLLGKSLAPVGGPQLAKVAVPSCLQLAAAQACPESGPSWLGKWLSPVGAQLAWKVAVPSLRSQFALGKWLSPVCASWRAQLAWKVAVPSWLGKWLSPVCASWRAQLAWKVAVPSCLGKWLSPVGVAQLASRQFASTTSASPAAHHAWCRSAARLASMRCSNGMISGPADRTTPIRQSTSCPT